MIHEVEKQNPGLVTQVQTGGGLTNLRKIQAGQADIGMTPRFYHLQLDAQFLTREPFIVLVINSFRFIVGVDHVQFIQEPELTPG